LRAAAIAVPETREVVSTTLTVAPGADEAEGFIGDNVGRFVAADSSLFAAGWPYDAADMASVDVEAARLGVGEASAWVGLKLGPPDARSGIFRIYRAADASVYVSPVYRFARPARTYVSSAPKDLLYVANDPSRAFADRMGIVYRHVRELTAARFEVALRLVAERRQLVVYFDPLLALSTAASGAGVQAAPDEGQLRDAYAAVDGRLGALVREAGGRSIVAVIGREPLAARADVTSGPAPAGFLMITKAPGELPESRHRADVADVAPTLLRLLGVPPDAGEPVADLAAWFPVMRDRDIPAVRHGEVLADAHVPLTSDSLRALGLLSHSTRAPEARVEAKEAASKVDD
jgi:hypothetical protein